MSPLDLEPDLDLFLTPTVHSIMPQHHAGISVSPTHISDLQLILLHTQGCSDRL